MATVQFNTRIDEQDKVAGDEAFAQFGYTPSRVAQATWAFAARNRTNKKELRRLLELLEGPTQTVDAKEEEKLAWVARGPQIYKEALARMGVAGTPQPLDVSDEELLYEAYLDKMEERGMTP